MTSLSNTVTTKCSYPWKADLLMQPCNPGLAVSSVQFSCSVASDSLWPLGLQHARLPCPSPTPGACSNSCPSNRWWHPTQTNLGTTINRIEVPASWKRHWILGGGVYFTAKFIIIELSSHSALSSVHNSVTSLRSWPLQSHPVHNQQSDPPHP